MNVTYRFPGQSDSGQFSQIRMRPQLPVRIFPHLSFAHSCNRFLIQPSTPINYASATIPTFAPYGTDFTPSQHIRIVGGRRIPIVHAKTTSAQFSSIPIRENS